MGLILALATALLFGYNPIPAKRLTRRGWSEFGLSWWNLLTALLVMTPAALLFGRGRIEPIFWPALFLGILGNLVAVTLFYSAIRISPVSIVMPLVSLSPLFMLVTSRLMIGEALTPFGGIGVLFTVAGIHLIGLSTGAEGLAGPFRALWRDPGARRALAVAFIWSITSNLDKICVRAADPFTYSSLFALGALILYSPIAWSRTRLQRPGSVPRAVLHDLGILGLGHSFMLMAQMIAILLLPVPYVIAIKRSGMLLSVVLSGKDGSRRPGMRLGGAAVILLGLVMILFRG